MAGYHAPISFSSMDRTVACNAWIQLSEGLPPQEDTEQTQEGNAADWVAKQWAAGNEVAHGTPIPLPGDFTVDYDMIHGAKLWTKVLGYGAVSGVPVVAERIHPSGDCWGEPDGWRWDAIAQELRVPDYKYGFGIVEVFQNYQLMPAAIGLIDTLGLVDSDVTVIFTICQPRAPHPAGPVREWRIRGDYLRQFANIMYMAAHAALDKDNPPMANVGPHCLHCPAKLNCLAHQEAVSKVLEFARVAVSVALDPINVGVQLLLVQEAAKLLKGRADSLEQQAESYLRAGKRVPNFCMEPTGGSLAWNDGVTGAEIIAVGKLLPKPVDLVKPPGALNSRSGPVVTPTQAIKAGVDATVISQYATRPSGAMKLARASTTEARRAFGDTTA